MRAYLDCETNPGITSFKLIMYLDGTYMTMFRALMPFQILIVLMLIKVFAILSLLIVVQMVCFFT